MPADSSPKTARLRSISRVIGAIIGFCLGLLYGGFVISNNTALIGDGNTNLTQASLIAFAAAGAAFLAAAAPLLSIDPYHFLVRFLDEAPAADIAGATIGLLVALALAACVAILLGGLPDGIGFFISLALAAVLVTVGVRAGRRRRGAFAGLLSNSGLESLVSTDEPPRLSVVVDTSVLVDARIVDIAKTGFLTAQLVIATFVLEELQRLADAGDATRRAKGKRGLQTVEELKQTNVLVEIIEANFPGITEVDARLIKLARVRNASLMTNDFNLNRVASVEGLQVLNLNNLVNALKPIALSGDSLEVEITKPGRERHQGIGHLPDGTMVVVENADRRIGQTVSATVTSVLQTASGRMVFAVAQPGGESNDERTLP